MVGKVALLLAFSLVCVHGQLELRVPRIDRFFGRITNTTFGIIRGGVNFFSRTIDRIINTFGKAEDRIRAVLEELRKIIIRGLPEFNIPVLDPLKINKIDFDVSHEAIKIKGNARNVTIKYISKYNIDNIRIVEAGSYKFNLHLNISFPFLSVDGNYKIDGKFGDSFRVFGDGPFWLKLYDLKLATITTVEYRQLKVVDMDINLKLGKLENNLENFMEDKETGDLLNKAISKMAPEAIDLIWPEIRSPVQKQVMKYINNVLDNTTIANLARRLFNIF